MADERAQQAAQRRRTRRLRQLVGALTALVLVTVGLAGYAFQQRQMATTAKNLADSRSVAIEANEVRTDDPALAAQLSLAAYRITPSSGALASLLESSGVPAAARMFDSDRDVQSRRAVPAATVLAVAAADGTLRLWNVSRPGHPTRIGTVTAQGQDDALYAAAFSPDGSVLAAAGADGTVSLWKVTDPRHPVSLGRPLTGPASTIYSLAFSPDRRAAGGRQRRRQGPAVERQRPGAPGPGGRPADRGGRPGPGGGVQPERATAGGRQRRQHGPAVEREQPGQAGAGWQAADRAGQHRGRGRVQPGRAELAAGSHDDKVWLWNIANPAKPVPATA